MARESVRNVRAGTGIDDLPASHWKQLHDVWQPGRPDTRVQHVLVGPSGIHVIDYLLQSATAADAATQTCADKARTIGELLPDRYRSRVRAVVCIRNQEPVAESMDGVTVTSLLALEHILRESPVVLSTCEVTEIGLRLQGRLQPFPVAPADPRGSWSLRRRIVAWVAAAAVVAGAVVVGPELVEATMLR